MSALILLCATSTFRDTTNIRSKISFSRPSKITNFVSKLLVQIASKIVNFVFSPRTANFTSCHRTLVQFCCAPSLSVFNTFISFLHFSLFTHGPTYLTFYWRRPRNILFFIFKPRDDGDDMMNCSASLVSWMMLIRLLLRGVNQVPPSVAWRPVSAHVFWLLYVSTESENQINDKVTCVILLCMVSPVMWMWNLDNLRNNEREAEGSGNAFFEKDAENFVDGEQE